MSTCKVKDEETLKELEAFYKHNNYLLDRHGVLGKIALHNSLQNNETGIFIETAHPKSVVRLF